MTATDELLRHCSMTTRILRFIFGTVVFGVTFVVNPAFVAGCDSSDDDGVDTAKIRAGLVESLDMFNGIGARLFEHDGQTYEMLFELSQSKRDDAAAALAPYAPSFMSVAHACGVRTFYQSASACSTHYELAVDGTFTLRRLGASQKTIASDVPVHGALSEYEVYLSFGNDDDYVLIYDLGHDGGVVGAIEAHDLGSEKLDLSYMQH